MVDVYMYYNFIGLHTCHLPVIKLCFDAAHPEYPCVMAHPWKARHHIQGNAIMIHDSLNIKNEYKYYEYTSNTYNIAFC